MDMGHPEATELVKLDSHKLVLPCRKLSSASNEQIHSIAELGKENSRCNNDSIQIGQEAPNQTSCHGQAKEVSEEVDLEAARQKCAQSPMVQPRSYRSVKVQPMKASVAASPASSIWSLGTGGKSPASSIWASSTGKSKGSSIWASNTGAESRLKTLIMEQSWISVYKRLYITTILLNFAAFVLAASGHFPYAKSKAFLFALGNIVMCVLVRNEVFLRVVYWFAVLLLGHWWVPLKLKTMTTALLQSLGGIHSGCGLGAIMWLAYGLDQTFRNLQNASGVMVGVAVGILFLLLVSSLAAFPILRHVHHNIFESVHRFAGWSSLGLVWIYVVLESFWVPATKSFNISNRSRQELMDMESLWLTVATTIMLILPWLSVRRVAVEAVVPSGKLNTLLHFKGAVKPGLLARISPSPFSEWHAFGIVSDGRERHTLVAGAVGDFTASLVEHPPTHIWIRTFYFAGLPYLTNLYERVVQVATGSGIGVNLSFVLQQTRTHVHLIWIAKRIRESFGEEIWQAVNNAPANIITVIDTAVSGRPKTVELVVRKAIEWKADVVTVTSNPSGTRQIVNGCKAVGIPAFGPIWDS